MAHNPTILITRPEPQATRFAQSLGAALDQGSISVLPLTQTVICDAPIGGSNYPIVAFTSENGVRAASGNWNGPKGRAFAVGNRTTQIATEMGWQAVSADGTGADLADLIAQSKPTQSVLWPSGRDIRSEFPDLAAKLGVKIERLVVYRMKPTENGPRVRKHVEDATKTILPVFSPRAAEILHPWVAQNSKKIHVVAISQQAAKGFQGFCDLTVAQEPNGKSMIWAIASIYPPLAS